MVAAGIERALAETTGDVLAFLPGLAEIRQTERALAAAVAKGVLVMPLYPGLFTGPARCGAHRVAEFVRILAVTCCHDPTSYEVGYGLMNNPG